ncbi:MAG TPA: FtsW/RodA/SpoVE family cell cycle protein, partial [Jiangellaceae bacterium]|nr:FtsW/RodA/SpoVE family cell cycle protein [Jiangellaceae bacterium]
MTSDDILVPRRGRGTELALLIFAIAIATAAYVSVDLGANGNVPANAVAYMTGLLVLTGIAHVVIRRFAPYADPLILPIVVTLNGLGLAMIHRLDLADGTTNAATQLTWMVVGVLGFVAVVVFVRDHRILSRYTYTAALLGIILLMLPMLPVIGHEVRGARIWIQIGSMTFQPGEAAKIVLIIAF